MMYALRAQWQNRAPEDLASLLSDEIVALALAGWRLGE
jgi:hypothetical protein